MFPTIMSSYWYFSAYVGLFMFIPLINSSLEKINKGQYTFILFVLIGMAGTSGFLNKWFLMGGYSTMWLVILYLIGAYIKKFEDSINFSNKILILIILCSNVISTALGLFFKFYIGGSGSKIAAQLLSYVSIMNITSAICVFLVFTKIKITSNLVIKWIKYFTPLAFSAYLVQDNPLVSSRIIHNNFIWLNHFNGLISVILIILISLIMFLGVTFIDFIRLKLFTILGINKIIKNLSRHIEEFFIITNIVDEAKNDK